MEESPKITKVLAIIGAIILVLLAIWGLLRFSKTGYLGSNITELFVYL